ncbi:Las1-like-domain-containing protein [Aspergillus crustosus]
MAKVIFTPWRTQTDLLAVRGQFYPAAEYDGPDLRAQACATVGAWKIRGNLPHPIEATALLTDAILHDDAQKNSVFSIRATYSAAFCRFVTGLVDSKLYGARKSMFGRAMDLGLPASFVELRHEATHRELPSLTVLRESTARSLSWLWDFYWSGVSHVPGKMIGGGFIEGGWKADGDPENQEVGVLRGALERARGLVDGESSGPAGPGSGSEPPKKKRKVQQELKGVAGEVVSILKSSREATAAARVMLRDEVLVSKGRSFGDPLKEVIGKWDPFLQSITEGYPSFLVTLTETMVDELAFYASSNSETDPHSEGVYIWLDHILQSAQWSSQRRVLTYSYLLAVCEESSNHWISLLKKSIGKGNTTLPTISKLSSSSVEPDSMSDADDDLKALSKYGWDTAETWDSRRLGIV